MLQVNIQPTTDFTLEPWSYSRLTDLNTCEVWGFVRGGLRKQFPSFGRSMALEAGSAAHEAFAALRLYQLLRNDMRDHFEYHTKRIFGQEKGASLIAKVRGGTDHLVNATAFAIDALHLSGFYDDPMDKRRTMANIEEAVYAYIRSTSSRANPVWVQDVDKPDGMVGIELPFDFTLDVIYKHDRIEDPDKYGLSEQHFIRYIGTIDAIHISKQGYPYVEENKTASRLGDAWAASFQTSHQITGYVVAARALLGAAVSSALVHGVSLPQPRKATTWSEGIRSEYVERTDDQISKFFQWVYSTYLKRLRIGDDVENAVQYTHSCNRYFQACSLIPLCNAGGADERRELLDSMIELEASPSELAAMEKSGE